MAAARRHGFSAEPVLESAYVGSSKNLNGRLHASTWPKRILAGGSEGEGAWSNTTVICEPRINTSGQPDKASHAPTHQVSLGYLERGNSNSHGARPVY